MSRSVYLETYGCQMNVNDSQILEGRFQLKGCRVAATPEEADLILLNTCAVRENAEERVFGRLGQLKKFKKRRNNVVIGVTGCMAQRLGAEILERAGHVDLVVGTGSYGNIFELLKRIEETGEPQVDLSFGARFTEIEQPRIVPGEVKTFLSIMEGCNKSCSFCIVPYTRGKERYKPLGLIIREAEEIAARGIREVTLLGQNINSYRHEKWRFADVLTEVNKVTGLCRIRFTTSHPINTDRRMLEAMARADKVCETLQLPLQSGSDRVLEAMRRGYTLDRYRKLVGLARSLMPGLAITTDLIVGFPGETDADYEMTVAAMEEIRFDSAFMFRFSARRGTRASAMGDPVPDDVALARLQRIIDLQRGITNEISRSLVGSVQEILVQAPAVREPGCMEGKTRTFKPVIFPAPPEWIGAVVPVRIVRSRGVALFGEPSGPPALRLPPAETAVIRGESPGVATPPADERAAPATAGKPLPAATSHS
jgi:tRNA-2-methylthio-N6-dimethylallyladenosine synthase